MDVTTKPHPTPPPDWVITLTEREVKELRDDLRWMFARTRMMTATTVELLRTMNDFDFSNAVAAETDEEKTLPTTLREAAVDGEFRDHPCEIDEDCEQKPTLTFNARKDTITADWYACGREHLHVLVAELEKIGWEIL